MASRPLTIRFIGTGIALCTVLSAGVHAQQNKRSSPNWLAPRGSDTLSQASVAESLLVLRTLDQHVLKNPGDAAAWYHRGMIAWSLATRGREKPALRGIDGTRLGRLADTSLRIARDLQPDSVRYKVMSQRYVLAGQWGPARWLATTVIGSSANAIKHPLDAEDFALAALHDGRDHWKRYDTFKDRRMPIGDLPMGRSILEALRPGAKGASAMDRISQLGTQSDAAGASAMSGQNDSGLGYSGSGGAGGMASKPGETTNEVRRVLGRSTMILTPPAGEADYIIADSLFHDAFAALPTDTVTFIPLAMLLADRNRWIELESVARLETNIAPRYAAGWMTLGLALQRQHKSSQARVVFDSAMALYPRAERARLNGLKRILTPDDATRLSRMSDDERDARIRGFWMRTMPLWSDKDSDVQTEFLSRVWYAELRWTVPDYGVRGSDTDRGDIYTRYGPPDSVAAIGPVQIQGSDPDIVTFWLYNNGLIFAFKGYPVKATATIPLEDLPYVDGIKEQVPVRWDNIASVTVDSLLTQIARFRAGDDSIDVILAGEPPVDSIRASSDIQQRVRAAHWIIGNMDNVLFGDSTRLDKAQTLTWTHRLARGNYIYRVEASADGAKRGAAAMAVITANNDARTGFSVIGFGTSDMLLTTNLAQAPAGTRWATMKLMPLGGSIARHAALDIAWENYEFGEKDGVSQYTITLTVTGDKSASGKLAMKLVGLSEDVARIDRSANAIVMKFDRTTPFASTFADQLRVDLGDSPAGSYAVTLEIADHVTGRTTTRTSHFVVRE